MNKPTLVSTSVATFYVYLEIRPTFTEVVAFKYVCRTCLR